MSPLSRIQRLRARRLGRRTIASIALAATASVVGLIGGLASLAAGDPVSIIVRFDANTSVEQRDAAIAAVGGTVVDAIPVLRMEVVQVPEGEEFVALETLRADDIVTTADLDRPREAQAAPNDPGYDLQWALDRIGWGDIYGSLDLQGTSRLAVLDTGVDANDPDLADRIIPGWSAFEGETAYFDPNGHGTALASIAASVTDNGEGIAGVAYGGVEILPVQVLDGTGVGQDADIIEGLVWAVDNGADVALMGFSSTGYSSALQAAVEYAWSNNVVVIAAVGNDGDDVSHFPAAMAKVVGVSATNQSDERWSGSNFGSSVFMAAPGTDIESVLGPVTGTSPAAALVAGAAALLQAVDPGADPGVIVGRLARNADPVGTIDDVGNGILNLAAAVADTGTESVVPVGGSPVGDGGPYVTYQAAVRTFSATATISNREQFVGKTGISYSLTINNTSSNTAPDADSSVSIGTIRVVAPTGWVVSSCDISNAPAGSTQALSQVSNVNRQCDFRVGVAGTADNIAKSTPSTDQFRVVASITGNNADRTGAWTVTLDPDDTYANNQGYAIATATAASTGSLTTTGFVWEVTDVYIASSLPTVGGSCSSGKSAPAGQLRNIVVCGRNWGSTSPGITPAEAISSLTNGSSLYQTAGTWQSGQIPYTASGTPPQVVLAYYRDARLSNTAGSASVEAKIGTTSSITSPTTPVSGFTLTPVPDVRLSSVPASPASIAETGGSLTLRATASTAYAENITVNLTYSQSPTQSDFSGDTSITILANQDYGEITVSATGDSSVEGNENFTVDISSVTNGLESGTQQVAFSIIDDDFGTVAIDLACQSGSGCLTLTEGSAADVETNKLFSNISNTSTTSITVSQVVSPGAVGNTVETKALIRIDSELMNVTANTCLPTVSVGTCTYTVERGVNGSTAASHNANAKVILVQRLPLKLTNSGDVAGTIDWETAADPSPASGTVAATPGASCFDPGVDYVTQSTATVSLSAAGSSNITVRVCRDTIYEGPETFAIKLSNATGPAGAAISPSGSTYRVVTILHNIGEAPTLAINNRTLSEGSDGTTAFGFTVTRTFPAGTTATTVEATVDFTTADGATPSSAATTADNDYTATSGTLTFAVGDPSKPISVSVIGDTKREVTETFRVLLSNAAYATITTGTGTGTITNDDDGITFSIGLQSGAASKAEASTTFPMRITSVGTVSGSVSYSASGTGVYPAQAGTSCTAGVDFFLTPSTVVMGSVSASEVTATSDFSVTVCEDTIYENSETFSVTLASPTVVGGVGTATLGSPTFQLTITNDDSAPAITFSPAVFVSANEGNAGQTPTVTVTLAREPSQVATTVNFAVTGSGTYAATASDFAGNALPTGTASFASGADTTTFTFNLNGDATVETGETYTITLSNVSPAATATLPAALAGNLIVNDDTVISIAWQNDPGGVPTEGEIGDLGPIVDVTLLRGYAPVILALTYTGTGTPVNGGTRCQAGDDYYLSQTTQSVPLNTAAPATYGLRPFICADAVAEASETLRITLSVAGGHAIVAAPSVGNLCPDWCGPYAELVIIDNDKTITGRVVADRDGSASEGGTDVGIKDRPVLVFRDDGDGSFGEVVDGVFVRDAGDEAVLDAGADWLTSGGGGGASVGDFTIKNLSAGVYWVTHTVQSGFEAVYASPGATAVTATATGYEKNLLKVTVTDAIASASGNRFFETRRGSSISGEVVDDLNGNGAVGAGEPGLPSATVALYRDDPLAANGGSVGTRDQYDELIGTLTGGDLPGGVFVFGGDDSDTPIDEDLLPGTYFIVETNPTLYADTGYTLGTVTGGATGSAVTRVDDNEFKVVLVNASTSTPTSSGNYFLDAAQSGTIAGAVRDDTAGDGLTTGADSMALLGGATITITRDNTRTGTIGSLDGADTQTWTPSATAGTFSQASLTPGVYFVTASRTTYLSTNVRPDPDGVGTADKIANDQVKITIPSGGGVNGDNAFLLSLAQSSVSGYVYDDVDANTLDNESPKVGVSGAVVRIYRETSTSATGSFDFVDGRQGQAGVFDPANDTTTEQLITTLPATGASGAFLFSGLRSGTYYLVRTNPATWQSTNAFQLKDTVDRVRVSVNGALASVSSDTVFLATLATAQIGVSIFEDVLGNSVGDTVPTTGLTDDTALTGASLALYRDDPVAAVPANVGIYDAGDMLVSAVDLPSASAHTFTGLRRGTYFVVETQDPTNYRSATAVPGSGASTVSSNEYSGSPSVLEKNRLKVVVSLAGAISSNNRFVDVSVYAISGFVLNDSNANGSIDDGGLRIPGAEVTLYVDAVGSGTVGVFDPLTDPVWAGATGDLATKTTGATGGFGFGLSPLDRGTYFVKITVPASYKVTNVLPSSVAGTEIYDPDNDPNTDNSITFNYGASEETTSDATIKVIQVDLGLSRTSTGNRFLLTRNDYVISGLAVDDDEADLLDAGDLPLSGTVVKLYKESSAVTPTSFDYIDADGNGAFDAATETTSESLQATSSATLANGEFSFGGLTYGTYYITGIAKAGYSATQAIPGTGSSAYTESTWINRTTIRVVITAPGLVTDAAQVSSNNRFLAAAAASTISGSVKDDIDADGVDDDGPNNGLANATVELWLDSKAVGTTPNVYEPQLGKDTLWATAPLTPAITGAFSFTGLPTGTYFLVETDPTDYDSTNALPDGRRQTIDRLVVSVDGTVASQSIDNVFLDALATATLSGVVFDDADGNGSITFVVDPVLGSTQSEFGKNAVAVQAFRDADEDGIFDAGEYSFTGTTATLGGVAGSFTLTGLMKGRYVVTYTIPTGWRDTVTRSSSTAEVKTVSVARAGASTGSHFFTQQANATILGQVFNDLNGDGAYKSSSDSTTNTDNIRVYIDGYDGVLPNGTWDSSTEPSAVTTSTGTFTITGVAKGAYKVQIVLPENKVSINAPVAATVAAGGSASARNIGIQAPSTLTGYVYEDRNASGTLQKDVGTGSDVPMDNVTVWAYRDMSATGTLAGDGNLTAADITGSTARAWTTTTNSDGYFTITGVPTGTYFIIEGAPVLSGAQYDGTTNYPTGYRSTASLVCQPSCTAANTTGYTASTANRIKVTISPGAWVSGVTGPTTDPGYFLDTPTDSVTISGKVYIDTNGDGVLGAMSSPLSGAVVKVFKDIVSPYGVIQDNGDNIQQAGEDLQMWPAVGSASTTTTNTGIYSWTGLPTGSYLVKETDPSGYSSTNAIPDPGGAGRTLTDISDDVIGVNVAGPSTAEIPVVSASNDFLDTPDNNVTVGGFVYDDLDGDGNKDTISGTDQVLPDVQVRVYRDGTNNNGTFDYTDANGNGRFDVGETTINGDTLIHATRGSTGTRGEYETTAANGSFSFSDLPTGTHFIVQTLPSGYSAVKTRPDPATTVGNITATPVTLDKTVIRVATSGATPPWSRTDLQFLNTRDDGVTIRGFVYSDTNGNGVYDGSDFALTSATVAIYKDDGNGTFSSVWDRLMSPIVNGGARASSKTNLVAANGYLAGEYSFSGLPTGTYFIVETDPTGGYTSTGVQVTNAKASADVAAPKDRIKVANVAVGETISGNVFLDALTTGSLSGVMVDDLNGNGIRDTSKKAGNSKADDPLNDGTITIYKDDGDGVLETDGDATDETGEDTWAGETTTSGTDPTTGAALGVWSFSDLLPGTYFIRQDPPTVEVAPGEFAPYQPTGATFPISGGNTVACNIPLGNEICQSVAADSADSATPKRVTGEWLKVRLSPFAAPERMSQPTLSFLAQTADFQIAITDDYDLDGNGSVDAVASRYAGTPSAVGEPGIYTITLTNVGAGAAPAGALITVTHPAGTNLARITGGSVLDVPGCTSAATQWTCETKDSLAAGASVQVQVAVQVPANSVDQSVVVSATVASPADNNLGASVADLGFNGPVTDTDTISRASHVSIVKTETRAAIAGATGDAALEYSLVVTNAGPSDTGAVVVTETLPDATAFSNARYCVVVPGSQPCTADAAYTAWGAAAKTVSLGVDETQVVTLSGFSSGGGTKSFQLTYGGQQTVSFVRGTNATAAAVQAGLEALSNIGAGNVTVTGTTNAGPFTVVFRGIDALPLTVACTGCSSPPSVSVSSEGSGVAGESGVWSWGATGPAAGYQSQTSRTIMVRLDVDSDVNGAQDPNFRLTNSASVTSAPLALSAAGDRTSTVQSPVSTLADLSVSKSTATAVPISGTSTVIAGDTISYHIDIANPGPSDAQGVDLAEALPTFESVGALSGVTWCAYVYLPATSPAATPCTPTTSLSGLTPTFSLANPITKGQTIRVIVRGTILSSVDKDEELTNEVTVSSLTPDPDAPDLTDSVTDTVRIVSDLGAAWNLTTTSPAADPMIGEAVSYDLVIRNLGLSDSRDITVDVDLDGLLGADVIDAELETGTTCDAIDTVANTVSCDIAYLSAGDDQTIRVTGTAGLAVGVAYPATTGTERPPLETDDIWVPDGEVTVASTYSSEPAVQVADNVSDPSPAVDKRPVDVTVSVQTLVPMYGKPIVIDATVEDAEDGPISGRPVEFLIECTNGTSQTFDDAPMTDADGETQAVFTVDVQPNEDGETCKISAFHLSGTSKWADGTAETGSTINVDKFVLHLGYTAPLFVDVSQTGTLSLPALVPQGWAGWAPDDEFTSASASMLLQAEQLTEPQEPEITFIINKVDLLTGSLTWKAQCHAPDAKDPESAAWDWTFTCSPAFTLEVPATYEITMRVPDSDPYFQAPDHKVYVTYFQPGPDMYAAGGGFVIGIPGTGGDPGLIDVSSVYDHLNFSFNVKYKKGSNTKTSSPFGAFFLRFRGEDGMDYRARSTSWNKGALSFTGLNSKASFQSAMTLSRYNPETGLADPNFGGGNYTLRVDVTGDVLAKTRTIAFTIYTPKGSIIFYQVGTLLNQRLLGGGSIVVKSK